MTPQEKLRHLEDAMHEAAQMMSDIKEALQVYQQFIIRILKESEL